MGRKLVLLENNGIKKGDIFELGDWNGKPITWQVIQVISRGAICLATDVLSMEAFDKNFKANEGYKIPFVGRNDDDDGSPKAEEAWKNSTLCKWLNGTFKNQAFSSEEKKCLQTYSFYTSITVSLLRTNEITGLKTSDLKAKTDWWLSTCYKDDNGKLETVAGITAAGNLTKFKPSDKKGVRPAIIVSPSMITKYLK